MTATHRILRPAAAIICATALAATAGCSLSQNPPAESSTAHSTTTQTQSPTTPASSNTTASSQTTATTGAATTHAATFDAIVAFGGCSGSIVRFPDQHDDDTALLLTNGHCTKQDLKGGKFVTNLDGNAKALVFKGDTPHEAGVIGLDRLEYATMSTTDVGIYRTTATYKELRDKAGINARVISSTPATPGMNVAVTSGYWKTSWDCTIEKTVPIVEEAGYRFGNVFTYERSSCHTKPGSSGAPVIDKASGEVVAINNSGNVDGQRCTEDNPCEIYPDGRVEAIKGAGYATQTALLTKCFTKGEVDLNQPECALPGGKAYVPVPATPAP